MTALQRPLRAVLFDIDDTLVDTAGAFAGALAAVAETHLPEGVDARAVLSHWRRDPGGHYRAYEAGTLDYGEQRYRRAELVQSTFGGARLGRAGFEAWNEQFEREFVAGWVPMADAAEAIELLDRERMPYGALSNACTDYQVKKLTAAGLGRVPMLVGVDTLGFGKPDPRVFHEAVRRVGALHGLDSLVPAEVAYLGDNPVNDARAATDAGLQAIWFTPEGAADAEPTGETFAGPRCASLCEALGWVLAARG
ncbi:HAD family hydrolase [Micrococcales bacterium 31B]|nr:HAD family hydrolase [Micrococcales bacterium 31B]